MKKILLSLLLAGGVQNSFVMGSCGGGGQAAESGSIVETQVPVVFEDDLKTHLYLQKLKALNSGLLKRILFTADGSSCFEEVSEDNPLDMRVFANMEDFVKFEAALRCPLQGEITDMVDFFKKADFLDIDTVNHLKTLYARDKKQFFDLCRALLEENPGFVLNMQRACPEILHRAIIDKELDFAKLLIESHADVNARYYGGWTALIRATRNGHIETVQLLIAAGANVDTKNNEGWTALIQAAVSGHTEIARLLIDTGANVDTRNSCGKTALMLAVRAETVQLLIAAGADVNVRDDDSDMTVLMMAAVSGHTEAVQLLTAAGADINARNSCGYTALMMAESAETVQLLIAAGADVNVRNDNGMTALMMAAEADGHTETVWLLIAAGADVNVRNDNGWTALINAATRGHTEIIRLLIAAGADVNARGRYGETALMMAERNRHTKTAQLLLAHKAID